MKKEDIADLKQLIEFLKEHQVGEFDLDRGDLKIRLKFNQPASPQAGLGDLARLLAAAPQAAAAAPVAHAAGPIVAGTAAAGAPSAAAPAAEEELHVVKSPIVGTYYGSPSPGAAAFV